MIKPKHLPPSFYDDLVAWERVESLLAHFSSDERQLALKSIFESLDHEILRVILEELEQEHHQEFLEMCNHSYHLPMLLEWLEEKKQGMTIIIKETVVVTKDQLQEILENEQ